MKRIAAIILAIALVICTIGAGATGGVDRIKINNLFEDLEYSLQEIGWDGRVNELIDCLDPNAVGLANWLIKLINVEPENLVGLVNAIIGVG